jgi:hypothetical protein
MLGSSVQGIGIMIENIGKYDCFASFGRHRDRMSQARELCFASSSFFNIIEIQEHSQDSHALWSFSFVIIVVKMISILGIARQRATSYIIYIERMRLDVSYW